MFTFYTDPGHGWLQVTQSDLAQVGLTPAAFSQYSYRSRCGRVFYLEEDCDAPRFIEAFKAKHSGANPIVKEVYESKTFVRNLPSIY